MDTETIVDLGNNVFIVLVLLVSAGITSHFIYGYGTRKAKDAFVLLVLLLIVGTQLFYLINAATYVPATRFYIFNEKLHRTDCLNSGKGGKRPMNEMKEFDVNPCFCYIGALCRNTLTGNTTEVSKWGECNQDTSICISKSGEKIEPFIPFFRDCIGGQHAQCTMEEPCHPCDRESLMTWDVGRCRTCSVDFPGDCNFVPNVGPYCYSALGSKAVVPCKRCCTERGALFVNDTCY